MLRASASGAGALAVGAPAAASGDDAGSGEAASDGEKGGDAPAGHDRTGEVITQTADVIGQGREGPVVAEDGATIWRTANEILVEVSMPTPAPGEYTYPSAPPEREGEWWTDETGKVEAFSLWAFTFSYPAECAEGECGSDDLGEPAGGGAFGVTGFVSDGGHLTLNGVISTATEPFVMGGEPLGVALERPLEAEVHLAVAPHGAFDPAMMPEQLGTPVSPPEIWWGAIFDPPAY